MGKLLIPDEIKNPNGNIRWDVEKIHFLFEYNGINCEVISVYRKNKQTYISFSCKNHTHKSTHEKLLTNVLSSGVCPECGTKIKNDKLIGKIKKRNVINNSNAQSYLDSVSNEQFEFIKFGRQKRNKTVIALCKKCKTLTEKTITNWNNGFGCKLCSIENRRIDLPVYLEKCADKHKNKYDYSLVPTTYKNLFTPVQIICNEHGTFKVTLQAHLNNLQGCPNCKKGFKGEVLILKFLEKENIAVEHPKRFPDCRYKNPLSFDFYLPDYKTCIEYDGLQHYQFVEIFHRTIEKFEEQQIRDKTKDDYCLENGIKLIRLDSRIYHDESTIFEKLKTEIFG